jgi:hypothetical protein
VAADIEHNGEVIERLAATILAALGEAERKALTPDVRAIVGNVAAFSVPVDNLSDRLAGVIAALDDEGSAP